MMGLELKLNLYPLWNQVELLILSAYARDLRRREKNSMKEESYSLACVSRLYVPHKAAENPTGRNDLNA